MTSEDGRDAASGADPTTPARRSKPAPIPHQPQFAEVGASWSELVRMFLKLGLVAFGGPVAHLAMMEREIVERRRWIDRQHFVDLMAATNLIPGPNSTQMTMHVGYVQKGDRGVWVAGTAFILPAALVTLAFAWAWVAARALPVVDAAFRGIQPVVLAIIVSAMLSLAPKAAADARSRVILVVAVLLAGIGVTELAVLALGAAAGWLVHRPWQDLRGRWRGGRRGGTTAGMALVLAGTLPALLGAVATTANGTGADPGRLWQLWWTFLRFGLTLFGSGYLLVAYLQTGLVDRLGLLTTSQLLEAIVIGEMTPGPLFTVSTAVGYLLGGVAGAAVATVAIFLPSFPLAMLLGRAMPHITGSELARHVLRGLGAAVLGVMLAVGWRIGIRTVVDLPSAAIALAALVLLQRTRIGPIALVPLGAAAGWAFTLL